MIEVRCAAGSNLVVLILLFEWDDLIVAFLYFLNPTTCSPGVLPVFSRGRVFWLERGHHSPRHRSPGAGAAAAELPHLPHHARADHV